MTNIERFKALVAQGKNNREIGQVFNICAATVVRIKKRLGIEDKNARKRSGRKPKII